MALGIEQKQQIVAEVNEVAASALSAVLADYRGLTVAEMTEMRVKRARSVYISEWSEYGGKRAVEGTEYECLNDAFVGPTLLAFSQEDPGRGRLLKDYVKDLEDLEIKALSIGGEVLPS